jgi:hypothetical protein
MLGKQLQLVEGERQWEACGLALIRQEQELQQVHSTHIYQKHTISMFTHDDGT